MHCRELAGPVGLAYKIIQDGKAFSSASAELSIVFAEGLRKTKAALRTAFVAFIGWRAALSASRGGGLGKTLRSSQDPRE